MPKVNVQYVCQSCGASFRQWMGRCTTCLEWDSLQEEVPLSFPLPLMKTNCANAKPQRLPEVKLEEAARVSSGISELDRVLGGGIVSGSLVLVGGEPGIGKSTLLLQMAASFAKEDRKVLYVSAEESPAQLSARAKRIGLQSQDIFLLSESDVSHISTQVMELVPSLVILDSIQMLFDPDLDSSPGTLLQIRGCAIKLMDLAKKASIPMFVVGHVTKEGAIAGPKILEHLVDTVLYFEGEKSLSYRLLRAIKNRFGTVDEVGIFRMGEDGLTEVRNPSEMFLEEKPKGLSGSVVVSSLEGTRPLFLEIQALVCRSRQGFPNRRSAGIDLNRLGLLIAVLEKRAGLTLENCDVYINVAGGMKILEPAADLGLVMAIASGVLGRVVEDRTVFMGEVGLGGEVRHVQGLPRRIAEAKNLGFQRCVIPEFSAKKISASGIQLVPVKTVLHAIEVLFPREGRGEIR